MKMKINLLKFHFVYLEESYAKAYYKNENGELTFIARDDYSKYYVLSAEIKKDADKKKYIELICAPYENSNYKSSIYKENTLKEMLESVKFKNHCSFEVLSWDPVKKDYFWKPLGDKIIEERDNISVLFIDANDKQFYFGCDYFSNREKVQASKDGKK